MKIHHLNCGTLYPRFPRGTQSILYCLLVETNDGLLLVDSGFGTQDYQNPTWFTKIFISSLGMHRDVEAARSPRGFIARFYDPAQWSHQPMWVIHDEADGKDWFGLETIPIQEGLSPDVRLVPLPGHTPGHCGVAVET